MSVCLQGTFAATRARSTQKKLQNNRRRPNKQATISSISGSEPFALRIDGALKFCIDCEPTLCVPESASRSGNFNFKKQHLFRRTGLHFVWFGPPKCLMLCDCPECRLTSSLIGFRCSAIDLCSSVTLAGDTASATSSASNSAYLLIVLIIAAVVIGGGLDLFGFKQQTETEQASNDFQHFR